MKLGRTLNGGLSLFFLVFFMMYVGKFELSNFIIKGKDTWSLLFNIGIWYMAVTYYLNNLFDKKEYEVKE